MYELAKTNFDHRTHTLSNWFVILLLLSRRHLFSVQLIVITFSEISCVNSFRSRHAQGTETITIPYTYGMQNDFISLNLELVTTVCTHRPFVQCTYVLPALQLHRFSTLWVRFLFFFRSFVCFMCRHSPDRNGRAYTVV